MKTFTKFCLFALMLVFTTSLIAQQSYQNRIGKTAPSKQEILQLLHPNTVKVPLGPTNGKAVGDDCNNPEVITLTGAGDLPYSSTGQTTAGKINSYDNTCLNDFDGSEDMIYKMVLDFDTTLFFQLDPKGTTFTGFALNEQCFDNPTTTCLAVSTDTYGDGVAHGFTAILEAGTYYIIVDNYPDSGTVNIPDFDLNISAVSAVPNDDCANAIEVGEVMSLYYSTEQATPSMGDDLIDIWYTFTAPAAGDVTFSLCDSYFDTYLELYDACAGSLLDFNDDACGLYGLQSSLTQTVSLGETIVIRVAGFEDDDFGSGFLDVYYTESCTLVDGTPEGENCGDDDNGECATAISVMSGDTILGNLWADNEERDTDWFSITLASISNLKLAVIAEGPTVFGLVYQQELGNADCDNLGDVFTQYKVVPTCIEDSIEFMNLPAGTYYFVVAPNTYENFECTVSDFAYQAAFTVEANAVGTISGNVDNGAKAGIENVLVSADIFSTLTDGNGDYAFDVPVGTYDVTANGFAVGYSTQISADAIVTDGGTTTVDFELNSDAPVLSVGAATDYSKTNLTWTPITPPKGSDGTDIVMGDVTSDNNYVPSSTMDLNFTLTVITPLDPDDEQDWGEYFEITLPDDMIPNSSPTEFPHFDGAIVLSPVPAIVNGQTVYWDADGDYFWSYVGSQETHIINIVINVTVAGIVSGPQVADYFFAGDGYTGDPDSFDGFVTIFEEGGSYVPTYNVYRKLDNGVPGNEFIPLVKNIPDLELFDVLEFGGTTITGDWCYFVTQNMANGTESAASNEECVEVKDACFDAIDYGVPGDASQNFTMGYAEQIVWFKVQLPTDMDISISTCGSDFDTQFAIYDDCDNIPMYPDTVPTGAIDTVFTGCDGGGQAAEGYCGMPAGTYYVAVYGENDEFGNIEIEITQVQCLTIYENWSGFSTYMDPAPSTLIEDVLDDMSGEMILAIRQSPIGFWWPSENINTIVNITPEKGYKSKMTVKDSTVITGTEVVSKTVTLPKGASYLPVKVPYSVNITDLEMALGANLVIIYDIYTNNVLWPEGGLQTLYTLEPGFAYLINMSSASSYTFPTFIKSSVPKHSLIPFKGQNIAWNDVVNTGNPHIISIMKDALDEVRQGDLIGVFNTVGICVGITEVESLDGNIQLTAFGNDEYSDEIDGLEEGEAMSFRLYRPATEQEYGLTATFYTAAPNSDGNYATNGLSMISTLKLGSTAIYENELSSVNIYPNPSTGQVHFVGADVNTQITITNAQGQMIYKGNISANTSLDLSSYAKGVYMIKLFNDDSMRIQKIILK